METKFDICNTCGKESPYTQLTNINLRIGYVEGAGQHCFQPGRCSAEKEWQKENTAERLILDLLILNNLQPNDQEFGEKVRILIDNYKKQLDGN